MNAHAKSRLILETSTNTPGRRQGAGRSLPRPARAIPCTTGRHAGSHRGERPIGIPDGHEQRVGMRPRSRTDLNGAGCPHMELRIRRSEDDRQKVSAIRFPFIVLVGRPEMAKPGDQMAGGTVGRGRLLASHADREQVIDTLKAAFVRGLLTKDEFDLRVGQTLGSRTYAELAAVTADIPGRPIGAQLPPKRAQGGAGGGEHGGQVGRMHAHDTHSCGKHVGGRVRPRRGTDHGTVPYGYRGHRRRYRGLACSRDPDARIAGSEALQRAATAAVIPWRGRAGISAPGIWRPGRTVPASRSRSAAHRRSGTKRSCWPAIVRLTATASMVLSRVPRRRAGDQPCN